MYCFINNKQLKESQKIPDWIFIKEFRLSGEYNLKSRRIRAVSFPDYLNRRKGLQFHPCLFISVFPWSNL